MVRLFVERETIEGFKRDYEFNQFVIFGINVVSGCFSGFVCGFHKFRNGSDLL